MALFCLVKMTIVEGILSRISYVALQGLSALGLLVFGALGIEKVV